MVEQTDPILPVEILLRRIPEAQMSSGVPREPLPDAFDPHKTNDADGLSVYREKYHSPAEVAEYRTKGTTPSWVARIPARAITELGLTLRPDPRGAEGGLPARPGHALIVELNSAARKTNAVEEWKRQLVAAVTSVEGGDTGFAPPRRPSSQTGKKYRR